MEAVNPEAWPWTERQRLLDEIDRRISRERVHLSDARREIPPTDSRPLVKARNDLTAAEFDLKEAQRKLTEAERKLQEHIDSKPRGIKGLAAGLVARMGDQPSEHDRKTSLLEKDVVRLRQGFGNFNTGYEDARRKVQQLARKAEVEYASGVMKFEGVEKVANEKIGKLTKAQDILNGGLPTPEKLAEAKGLVFTPFELKLEKSRPSAGALRLHGQAMDGIAALVAKRASDASDGYRRPAARRP